MSNKIRIGIDVGGTFTHAVALDHQTYEVIAHAVTPTTHSSEYSVSEGIVKAFRDVLLQSGTSTADVVFVAHSTTQATNALLEGDVAKVGVIGMGRGFEAIKAKSDTDIKDIELSNGKFLRTETAYLNSDSADFTSATLQKTVAELTQKGCAVVVASEAFGIDDTTNEELAVKAAADLGIPATASHEISQLYGLKVRTRTAVVNASILPKMTQTAEMTDESIRQSGIAAPLMIMRSDGGVMDIAQMKKRPILTMLSGPAAGVAAALMHAKISDGVFLEVGGTSTDISAIKDGRAMLKSANVGGHSTFLRTLDSRTVGIGGGSMFRIRDDGSVVDVGPRSAHIAGLTYLAFADSVELTGVWPVRISPMQGDPGDYVAMQNPAGKRFAVTLTDAAMFMGAVKPGDYAYGNMENVNAAFKILADVLKVDAKELCRDILDKAVWRVNAVVQELLGEYELDPELVSLVGGGGGCTSLVPWLSGKTGMKYLIADKAEVISAIGAAMAMLRDVIAKTLVNPTQAEFLAVRRQAVDSLLAMGANADSIEVQMEIDSKKNIVRATATGSIQMENQDFGREVLGEEEIVRDAAASLKVQPDEVSLAGTTTSLYVYTAATETRRLFGIVKTKRQDYRVLDNYGVVKLQVNGGTVLNTTAASADADINRYLQGVSSYSDAGQILPEVFLLYGNRIVDFASVLQQNQVQELVRMELEGMADDTPVMMLSRPR